MAAGQAEGPALVPTECDRKMENLEPLGQGKETEEQPELEQGPVLECLEHELTNLISTHQTPKKGYLHMIRAGMHPEEATTKKMVKMNLNIVGTFEVGERGEWSAKAKVNDCTGQPLVHLIYRSI